MAITIHAPTRSQGFRGWLSRDGTSIVLRTPASTEPLRFQETGEGPSERSHWSVLDRILRSTGK